MLKQKKWRVAGAIASTVIIGAGIAAAVAGTTPAGAATTPAWHQVFSHHYGPANDYSAFTSTVAFGPGNVWELGGSDLSSDNGGQPIIVQWRGKGWTGNVAPAGLSSYVEAASANSASDIWAVTFIGGVLHYNGTKWTLVKQLVSPSADLVATGITAISPKNVWVFGNTGYGPGVGTWHFDGTTWRHETTLALGGNIGEASAVSVSNIWGFGASSTQPAGEIDHFTGSSWTPVSNPLLTGLTFGGIHAFSAANIWATAQASLTRSYLLHYGDHWSKVLIPWGFGVRTGVSSDGKGGLWFIAGPAGSQAAYAVHWFPGNKWQRFPLARAIGFGPVNIPGTSSVVAVGDPLAGNGSTAAVWVYGSI